LIGALTAYVVRLGKETPANFAIKHRKIFKGIIIEKSQVVATFKCGFNRSMQHLFSKHREGDVENEAKTEDLLLRYTAIPDVGSLERRRVSSFDRASV
jgi:hypothetical protein